MNFEFDLDLSLLVRSSSMLCIFRDHITKRTSQFVAVSGTLENIHPDCEGLSEDNRMYLEVLSQSTQKLYIPNGQRTGLRE
jgi:hypothetical protein